MSTVNVTYMNPMAVSAENISRSAGLINVQEHGEYTIIGTGEVVQKETVDDQGNPSTYNEAVGTGELRLLTRHVIKIDVHYDNPVDAEPVKAEKNDFGPTASQDSWKG